MEIENENVRFNEKSKIPLPKEPLPPIPQNLIKRLVTDIEREPLKTINQQPSGTNRSEGTSFKTEKVEKEKTKTKYPAKIDTRFVTSRQTTEHLDWNYEVFKDDTVKENSVIVISDNESDSSNELRYIESQNKKENLGEAKKAKTPLLQSPILESNKIRNIKRSLKRPHSRELQGLSPVAKHEKGEEKHKRRLFAESLQDKLQSPDLLKKSYMVSIDYTGDVYNYLLAKENKTIYPGISSITRACVINWLMKVNGINGNPAVIQTALWYFDSILAVDHIQLEKLQLVAAACYWISQKIHGRIFTAKRLVKCSSHAFTAENLVAAEKAVLYKLNFPMQPVLPQEFITYLSWCCDNTNSGEIEIAATFLCISGLMVDKVLCNEYPSVIGAAAVRNAILLLRKNEAVEKLHGNPVFKAAEKKTSNISFVCSVQRKAVRLISSPLYEYKSPLEYYDTRPACIAQKIITSAKEFAIIDLRKRQEPSSDK